jgi:uncharacterized protein (DUF2147 family)
MQIRKRIVTSIVLFYIPLVFAQSVVPSVEGNWITKDEKTGEPRAVLRLEIDKGILSGKVARIYPKQGDTGLCSNCPGAFKDKEILGMKIIWDLKEHSPGSWYDGRILDAKSGTIYRVKMMVKESNPNKLFVRGYVGISVIGRTQEWERETNA